MGIKDLFSSDSRREKRIEKLVRTVTSPFSQSADRYAAMQALLEDGSHDAIVGLFKRFTITSTKSIEDEEEKGWAYRKLSGLGPAVLPAAKAFCLSEEPLLGGRQPNIAWALRIIEDVADATQEWDLLQALLAKHPPEYSRYPTLKTQLLVHVAEIDDPRTVDILLGYLDDPDENVRFLAIESLLEIRDPRARPAFVARVCNPQEDSVRLRTRILDGLADLGWDVSDSIEVLSKNLGREHLLQAGKVVRR